MKLAHCLFLWGTSHDGSFWKAICHLVSRDYTAISIVAWKFRSWITRGKQLQWLPFLPTIISKECCWRANFIIVSRFEFLTQVGLPMVLHLVVRSPRDSTCDQRPPALYWSKLILSWWLWWMYMVKTIGKGLDRKNQCTHSKMSQLDSHKEEMNLKIYSKKENLEPELLLIFDQLLTMIYLRRLTRLEN